VDPGSRFAGLATVEGDEVLDVCHWFGNGKDTHPTRLADWFRFLEAYVAVWQPHMASIEVHAYARDKGGTATHVISYYQGVAAACCKLHGLVVIEARASTARSFVLGNGGLSKDKVWEEMRRRHPDLFSRKDQGGEDESDALVLALAGPTVAER
jgi:Holliday junction resolvasome RuvABC endonuclease subunit